MSGGGAGKVNLWDIRTGQSLKEFKEFGHYHRDNNLLDEVFDGKFSYCGNYFAVSTVWGTFSIYTVFDKEPFLATPVEQFFHLDKHADMESDIYNKVSPILCDFERLKYLEQPPLPILGEKVEVENNQIMTSEKYEFNFRERYNKNSKDHLFYEDFARQNEPYFFAGNRNDENQSNASSRERDSHMSSDDEEFRRDRPVYYDPNNDEFDRESDEDFIVSLENRGGSVRRRLRRTNDPPRVEVLRNRDGRRQREERKQRIQNRNRVRGEDESEEEDSIARDMEEHEEFEISDDYVSREIGGHISNDDRMSGESSMFPGEISNEIEEEKERFGVEKGGNEVALLSGNRVIIEENQEEGVLKAVGLYTSLNNNENFKFPRTLTKNCYQIDAEEAQIMRNEDKSLLD